MAAQQQPEFAFGVHEPAENVQGVQAGKSPLLAGLLSWLVWPGVGSYYAGNSSHGTRHVAISVVSLGGAIALIATCDSDGFCDFDHDAARLSVAIGLVAVYVGNSVWSIITAVSDAEEFNRQLTAGNVSFRPTLTRLTTPILHQPLSRLGLQVVNVRF
jgi:hypothetical protein